MRIVGRASFPAQVALLGGFVLLSVCLQLLLHQAGVATLSKLLRTAIRTGIYDPNSSKKGGIGAPSFHRVVQPIEFIALVTAVIVHGTLFFAGPLTTISIPVQYVPQPWSTLGAAAGFVGCFWLLGVGWYGLTRRRLAGVLPKKTS